MQIAVYPGSFDPITNGHIDIIERTAQIFDRVVVAVAINEEKLPVFTVEERVEIIRDAIRHVPNVEVDQFAGLLVDFMRQQQSNVVVRGLRAISDFEYEFQMAQMNKQLYPQMETLFMMTQPEHGYLSSRIVKEIARFGGQVDQMVPGVVATQLKEKLQTG
ncbi:MAG: pantetheine-phosphate adenylyltransferase [Armatimonadetes bacterium]|nr:pantetheine-phosphate adenylyltransferase [Armatimonadota bacterium]